MLTPAPRKILCRAGTWRINILILILKQTKPQFLFIIRGFSKIYDYDIHNIESYVDFQQHVNLSRSKISLTHNIKFENKNSVKL